MIINEPSIRFWWFLIHEILPLSLNWRSLYTNRTTTHHNPRLSTVHSFYTTVVTQLDRHKSTVLKQHFKWAYPRNIHQLVANLNSGHRLKTNRLFGERIESTSRRTDRVFLQSILREPSLNQPLKTCTTCHTLTRKSTPTTRVHWLTHIQPEFKYSKVN